ncbi:hypothetical protein [Burkholderia sp. PU8-34]
MISGTSCKPGRKTVAACGIVLALAAGLASPLAQSTPQSTQTPSGSTSSLLAVKIKHQVERGPVQPPAYPTQPQQAVRKLW